MHSFRLLPKARSLVFIFVLSGPCAWAQTEVAAVLAGHAALAFNAAVAAPESVGVFFETAGYQSLG